MTPASSSSRTALLVVGTRPEAIKLAPVVWALRAGRRLTTRVVLTGQHRDQLATLPDMLELGPTTDLGLQPGLPITAAVARCAELLAELLREAPPAVVVVQGDTSAAFAGALAGFHARIPVAHVEAGLRTADPSLPFPEEAHRRMITTLSTLHLAATEGARDHLLAERVPAERIVLTGNPIVDAVAAINGRSPAVRSDRRRVVATVHRRESWGAPMEGLADALAQIAREHPDIDLVVPAHPNPAVRGPLAAALGPVGNAQLVEPLPYDEFLALLATADLVLTDSGGIQEEAPSLGLRVLLLRDRTERPEAIAAGIVQLVGTDPERVVVAARVALALGPLHHGGANPFGDGHAGSRIAVALENLVAR